MEHLIACRWRAESIFLWLRNRIQRCLQQYLMALFSLQTLHANPSPQASHILLSNISPTSTVQTTFSASSSGTYISYIWHRSSFRVKKKMLNQLFSLQYEVYICFALSFFYLIVDTKHSKYFLATVCHPGKTSDFALVESNKWDLGKVSWGRGA